MPLVDAIVKPQWLRSQLLNKAPKLRVLHIAKELDGKAVPGSRQFNLDLCKDLNSPYKNMLPTAEHFSKYIGGLGIANENHVVVYDDNEDTGVFWAPRVWWMFRVFGHNTVSVLDGGLKGWCLEDFPTVAAKEISKEKSGQNLIFSAKFQPHLVEDYESIIKNITSSPPDRCQMMDSRSETRFHGEGEDIVEGIIQGHIIHAKNLPYNEFVDENTKMFKEPSTLKSVFNARGIDINQPMQAYCRQGVTACFLALASKAVGGKDVSVYDGSWCEFGQRIESEGNLQYITSE